MADVTSNLAPAHRKQVRELAPPAWAQELAGKRFALLSARVENVPDLAPDQFEERTRDAYELLARELGRLKRHPVRFWNHVPFITEPADADRDNYMVFNAGRFAAFANWFGGPTAFEHDVATASAIGHWGRDLVIHCLAADVAGVAINNPRQVAPYHYSRRFGPLPPCFSRATRLKHPVGMMLVGGTASVRGEDSVHIDHLTAQLRETFVNMASLVGAAAVRKSPKATLLSAFSELRAYYPDRSHAVEIELAIRSAFPSLRRLEMFHADLCRAELLVEIEGVADLKLLSEARMSNGYDAIIIGGGPGGATSALLLARQGFRVVVLEKSRFPRFHIGESILPRNFPLVQELGLEDALSRLPHLKKYGAEFGMGDDFETTRFYFDSGLIPGSRTFNIERSLFDEMLLNEAASAGAEVRQNTAVKRIAKLTAADVAVELETGETLSGRILLDASGHGTIVGRHLGTRRAIDDTRLHKVAYFGHFDEVERLPGNEDGHPSIIMCEEGWFWLIGLNQRRTSVGFVCHPELIKSVDVPANRMLQWAISRCPVVRHRMRNAKGARENEVLGDFSYTCKPFAGDGYFLVGDAGCFLDPIFSTGVTLAMMGATQAARLTADLLRGATSPERAQRQYIDFVTGSTSIFWRMIRNYYTHSFRELFLNGTGPMNVHGAIISILAGHVFPRPPWSLRWRLWLFEFFRHANKYVPLVRRRRRFSLQQQEPLELSLSDAQTVASA